VPTETTAIRAGPPRARPTQPADADDARTRQRRRPVLRIAVILLLTTGTLLLLSASSPTST